MKKISIYNTFATVLALVFFISPHAIRPARASQTQPIVINGGFEETTTTKSFGAEYEYPTDWTLKSIYSVNASAEYAISGKSVCISKGKEFTLTSANISGVTEGSFAFGFWCYSIGENNTAHITVKSYDSSGLTTSETSCSPITLLPGIWQEITVNTDFNDDVTSAQVILTINNPNSECYVDDVYVNKLANDKLVTLSGATIRLNVDTPGIRFRGYVNKQLYEDYKNDFDNVCAGILFTIQNNLEGLNDFTVEELQSNGKVYKEIRADIWNNADTVITDGYYGFNCAIVNILDKNIRQKYCARTYIKYEQNGQTKYEYGNFSLTENARSVQEVALLALEQNQDNLIDEQINILEYFAYYNESNT